MRILSIETSCDETAVSVLECHGNEVKVLGNALSSQIEIHEKYGGVFPALAKRAHAEKITTLLVESLSGAKMLKAGQKNISFESAEKIIHICRHEPGLAEQLARSLSTYEVPEIDCIAVTSGPGLEPALWVGINTATTLGIWWDKPVYPVNHMEGHVVSALFHEKEKNFFEIKELKYPLLALLVSGGHTELVLTEKPLSYKKIGQTRDDAVGEAFDKVARILGLTYPGGPKVSAFAKESREKGLEKFVELPRPMLHSKDYDFSFSGLKTAVLYGTKDKELTEDQKKSVAQEFEEASIEVLVSKTLKAIEEFGVQTLLVGGGVAGNTYLREQLINNISDKFPNTKILFPTKDLTTDNSVMIGMAFYYQTLHGKNKKTIDTIIADGNLSIQNT